MKQCLALFLAMCLFLPSLLFAAVRGKSAKYVGGTISTYTDKQVDGKWDLEGDSLVFTPKKKGFAPLKIPYAKVESIEYGQKVGRRLGAALATSLISPVGLFLLFSKKRKHFLTIGFKDGDEKLQGAVFQLAKGIVPESLKILETQSGKTIEYESEEAKKHAQKGE